MRTSRAEFRHPEVLLPGQDFAREVYMHLPWRPFAELEGRTPSELSRAVCGSVHQALDGL